MGSRLRGNDAPGRPPTARTVPRLAKARRLPQITALLCFDQERTMLDLYYWTTPNGHKITIFLEETGLPYNIKAVNIGKGEQFKSEFLTVSPNNRIPALVDDAPADGGKPLAVFESGAILLYLAEKTGQFIPRDPRARIDAIQWLFW